MSKDETGTSRREFLKKSAMTATGLTVGLSSLNASVFANAAGANEKVRVGFIGMGNRGTQLLERFMANGDMEVAALCDVYEPYTSRDRSKVDARWLETGKVPKMGEHFNRQPKRFNDFRELLDQKDIDAVCIATPDHWHAAQTIAALDAGKDIYGSSKQRFTDLVEREHLLGDAIGTVAGLNLNVSSYPGVPTVSTE